MNSFVTALSLYLYYQPQSFYLGYDCTIIMAAACLVTSKLYPSLPGCFSPWVPYSHANSLGDDSISCFLSQVNPIAKETARFKTCTFVSCRWDSVIREI